MKMCFIPTQILKNIVSYKLTKRLLVCLCALFGADTKVLLLALFCHVRTWADCSVWYSGRRPGLEYSQKCFAPFHRGKKGNISVTSVNQAEGETLLLTWTWIVQLSRVIFSTIFTYFKWLCCRDLIKEMFVSRVAFICAEDFYLFLYLIVSLCLPFLVCLLLSYIDIEKERPVF